MHTYENFDDENLCEPHGVYQNLRNHEIIFCNYGTKKAMNLFQMQKHSYIHSQNLH